MTPNPFLLESLESDGFTVTAADGSLQIGPKERLTPELRERIKASKRWILDDLEARQRHVDEDAWQQIAPLVEGRG